MHTVPATPLFLPSVHDVSETPASTKGDYVWLLERNVARRLGVRYAYACASGRAAVHTAIAALQLAAGDEVITTPITDMGELTPLLYLDAIPVFADVDPRTYNITARSIERALSPRTKAIIVSHLFGNPAEMDEICALANARGIPVIEDSAQAFGATYHGKAAGTIGCIGCFSGLVVTNDDALAHRMYRFINNAWEYGDPNPDHYFLALNHRVSEVQGAVAELQRLDDHIMIRRERARQLTDALAGIAGIEPPYASDRAMHSYWKYALRIDPDMYPGGPPAFARTLNTAGISSVQVFRQRRTFGTSAFPFTLAHADALDYRMESFEGTAQTLAHVLVIPMNECYTYERVVYVASVLADAARQLTRRKAGWA